VRRLLPGNAAHVIRQIPTEVNSPDAAFDENGPLTQVGFVREPNRISRELGSHFYSARLTVQADRRSDYLVLAPFFVAT